MTDINKSKTIFKFAILTISDSGHAGERISDVSGNTISEICTKKGLVEVFREIVPDEAMEISDTLIKWSTSQKVNVIFTTGGTGISPRDITPEATKSVIDIEIPGITEFMRIKTSQSTPTSILSRSVAGIRDNCLIINLPGSPKGVQECLEIIFPILNHTFEMIKGWKTHKEV